MASAGAWRGGSAGQQTKAAIERNLINKGRHANTPHTQITKTAIGYVQVSTEEQTTDGVSLDVQRDKLRAYCQLNRIKLIDIKADEGSQVAR